MALEPNVHWAGGNAPLPYWRRLNEAFTVYMRQWNLSVNAYAVLVLIYESGDGLEPARLAKMIGLKRQLVAIILRDLAKRGFVVRHPNAEDRRRRPVRFTRAGAAFADRVISAVRAVQSKAQNVFTPEEAARFREYSSRYVDAIYAIAGVAEAPDPEVPDAKAETADDADTQDVAEA